MKGEFLNPVRNAGISNGVKLTSAAYKLLEFFPESDPLKNKAKEKVLLIMSRLGRDPAAAGENSVQEDIDILLGYFEVGKSQGWISAINCLIICEEYKKIKLEIDFKTGIRTLTAEASHMTPEQVEKTASPGLEGGIIAEKKPIWLSARQEKIIEFLGKNQKAQVMDLKAVLPDITKRTIRRDLDELLRLGKIQRMGEFNKVFYKLSGRDI